MKLAIILLMVSAAWSQPAKTSPAANDGRSNLPAQKIGPNDLLSVYVYNTPELSGTVRVSDDGFIRMPMLKQRVQVDSLMPAQVEVALAAALQQEQILVDPYVTVGIAEYHSRPISVVGAVKNPTTFQAEGPTTLLEALARADGLAADAGPEILVTRKQQLADGTPTSLVQRVPVKGLIDAADADANLALTGGEEIRVPEAGKIFVVGNVRTPGAFPVHDAAESTLLQALAQAGGLAPYAGKQAYIIRREANGGKNEIPVELAKIMSRKAPDASLLPGDILYVPDAKGKRAALAALDKILTYGSGASAAVIYGSVR